MKGSTQLKAIFFVIFVAFFSPLAWAQSTSLPGAGFQTRLQTDASLPQSTGLYLHPGQNRSPNNQSEPYDPRHPQLGFVRWEANKMPLHIWISPGLKLPDLPLAELKDTRVDLVRDMLRQSRPFSGLETAPGWTAEMNEIVASGIEEWRQFESEGLIKFDFTDDPRLAHILIFFTDSFKDADAISGVAIGGNTCSQPLPLETARRLQAQGKDIVPIGWVQPGMNVMQNPIVIELSTDVNTTGSRLRGAAAHEFGHALGIIEHSPFRQDLMYVDRVVEELSAGDKATFRALYRRPAQGVF